MNLFLTSSPCTRGAPEGVNIPCLLNEANGFVDRLARCWKPNSKCCIVSANPDNFPMNDEMASTFQAAFSYHGLSLTSMTVCDARNEDEIPALLAGCDAVLLGGGHVPTQNAFFRRIRLKELLRPDLSVVMGISAGTMNCAGVVYAQPELPGESTDPNYKRFLPGLGLTEINVLPHYQQVKDCVLDGKRLFEEITYPDSQGRTFYALVDGSYLLVQNDRTTLYGEAYRIRDSVMTRISSVGDCLVLP